LYEIQDLESSAVVSLAQIDSSTATIVPPSPFLAPFAVKNGVEAFANLEAGT
jgi:hypothetical protein